MNLLTIRQLAAHAGISRAGILYYETEGLLVPARRSQSGYRLYGAQEIQTLQAIRAFRDAGLSIQTIKEVLKSSSDISVQLLEKRLFDLSLEIGLLKAQQILLARILAQATLAFPGKVKSKEAWVSLMRGAGMSDEDMKLWHFSFEKNTPDAHQKFLESLNLSQEEIAIIRSWSRELQQ